MEPKISYPRELPVSAHRDEILTAVRSHAVTIVCGDTGSGKTTQLPKMLLELGYGASGRRIAVTQPRRLAAVTMAERVAEELGAGEVGGVVGCRHRYAKRLSHETRLTFLTDGVLLAEAKYDRLLKAYDAILVDEAHERSLNIDFLLGLLRRILAHRRDLRVVIASATMDTAKFAAFFNAPVVNVPGRLFPVEIRYRPPAEDDTLPQAVAAAVAELPDEDDTLVFLSGERDIRETAEYLADVRGERDEIIPLLASLPAAEQRRAFRLSSRRRIVLATNVAETSVTIPGIRAVIDSGLARISRYVHRTQVQRLQIERISQASARQRTGRCGRLGPGLAIRLYAEEDFNEREAYATPEILRSSLAGVILTMLDLGLGAPEDFPFVDPPKSTMINEGLSELRELGALHPDGGLTPLGRKLARMPVEPRLGRMLIAASDFGVLPSLLPLVAAMSCDDPLRRPAESREQAAQAHAQWRVAGSDFLGTLKLWNWWRENTRDLSQAKARKLALKNFLSFPKMREWCELVRQLDALSHRLALSFSEIPVGESHDAALHKALLSGLLSRLGHYNAEDREYRGARGLSFILHPSSVLTKRPKRDSQNQTFKHSNARTPKHSNTPPEWIIAGELLDTGRLFACRAAVIDPRWIEPAAGGLCKHHVVDPRWDAASGFVRATEQVTLYGLVIVPARRCDLARFDAEGAREIFLRHGLLYGEFPRQSPLLRETIAFLAALRAYAEKTRRHEIFDEDRLLAHFQAAIPPDITNANALRKYLHNATPAEIARFRLNRADWWPTEENTDEDFPDSIRIGPVSLALSYRNTPENPEEDGITCTVRARDVAALALWREDWLVPGYLRDKVMCLLTCLPNALLRLLRPLEDSVTILLDLLEPGTASLEEAIRKAVADRWAYRIPADAWAHARIPNRFRLRFVVLDDKTSRPLLVTRDKRDVLTRFAAAAAGTRIAPPRPCTGEWTFGTIPETTEGGARGLVIRQYPALVADSGGNVSVRLFADLPAANRAHAEGILALLRTALARKLPKRTASFPLDVLLYLRERNWTEEDVRSDIRDAALKAALISGRPAPRTAAAFAARLAEAPAAVPKAEAEIETLFREILSEISHWEAELETGRYPEETADAVLEQLVWLVCRGFLKEVPLEILRRFLRYLKAVGIRLERARTSPASDRAKEARFAPYWQHYRAALKSSVKGDRDLLNRYRWLLEEFRLQIFAPELKTFETVSPKRLIALLSEMPST